MESKTLIEPNYRGRIIDAHSRRSRYAPVFSSIKNFFVNDFLHLWAIAMFALAIAVVGLMLASTDIVRNTEVTASGLVFIVGLVLAVRFLVRYAWRGRPWGTVAVHGSAATAVGLKEGRPVRALTLGRASIRPAEDLARHEAAHAVAAYVLGHRVTRVSIVVDGLSGGVTTTELNDTPLKYLDKIALTYAGPLAEGTGDVLPLVPGHDDDYSALMRLALAASITDPHDRTPGELFDEGTRMARELVATHEGAISAVAEALLDTGRQRELTEDEISELMNRNDVHPAKTNTIEEA